MAPSPIDEHLAGVAEPQRTTLAALRDTLRQLLPGAQECISYGMPCFKVGGQAVAGFEAFKNHCSYFPHSGNVVGHITDLPEWCTMSSKGTLQFPVDRPLPVALVRQLVKVREDELAAKATAKVAKAPKSPKARPRA